MGKIKRRIKVSKLTKKLGVLSLVLAMIIGVISNGSLVSAVDEAIANITFSSRIVKEVGNSTSQNSVATGDSFFLAISYNVNSGGDGVRYRNCVVSIELPKNIVFDGLADIDNTSNTFNSASVDEPFNDGTMFVSVSSQETLESGNSGTMYLKMHFNNMTTPDGTVANFDHMIMTGTQDVGSESQQLKDVNIPSSSIIATANQEWSIEKKVSKQNNANESIVAIDNKQYYKVNYQVSVIPGKGELTNGNRYGRLECTKFDLSDTLPTGYPAGGGAQHIEIKVGSKTLIEGTDYTLVKNDDGSIKAINFNYVSTYDSSIETGTHYVPDGAAINTTYDISVHYDYDAYEIPSNEPFIQKLLINKATLNYKPLDKSEVTVDSNANVQLGWQDQTPKTYDFTVTKKVTINSNGTPSIGKDATFTLNKTYQKIYYGAGENPVTFGLYEDPECTIVARGYQGQNTVGDPVAIDDDGKVKFTGVVTGTYYLKETDGPSLFNDEGVKKVVVSKDKITVDDKAITDLNINYTNTTDENGYGYVAFWKRGSSATQADAGWLKNVEFTLTSKTDPTKTYSATSNAKGLVLFSGIPAGEYSISENNSDGEFEQNDTKWDITVVGNKVNYPKSMEKYTESGIDYPYVLNTSSKGKFKIKKVSLLSNSTVLDGAEFKVYGPFDKEFTSTELENFKPNSSQEESSFVLAGNTESPALEKGHYVFIETKAPSGYTLKSTYKQVYVEKNNLAEVTVYNTPQGKLKIEKYGVLSEDLPFQVPLAGAQFGVYSDSNASIPVLDANGEPLVITSTITANGEASSNQVPLDAGSYYLKEIVTPEGYKPYSKIITVAVIMGATTVSKIENQVNQKGQLKLIKKDSKTNALLKNAEFEIYKDGTSDLVGKLTTDSKGEALSDFLDSGNYYLKETKAPSGHVQLSNEIKFVINDNQLTILEKEIANDPLVMYQIKKVDSETKDVLKGVIFDLYSVNPNEDASASYTRYTTNEKGLITFKNLIPGKTYYYREYKTLDNYQLDTTVKSFVAPLVGETNNDLIQSDGPLAVENTPLGKFTVIKTIQKMDSDEKVALSGIEFFYYPKLSNDSAADKSEAINNSTYISLGTTSSTGKRTSGYLTPGEYWVDEKESVNYKKIAPKSVTVLPGKVNESDASVKFENQYANGQLKIKKISSVKDTPVVATFNVYNYEEGITDYSTKTAVTSFTTNSQGEYTTEYLKPGKYVLVEQSVAGKYVIDQTPREFIIEEGKTNTDYTGENAIVNIPYSSLSLTKVESWKAPENTTVTMPAVGFKFNVYKAAIASKNDKGAIEYNGKYYVIDGEPVTSLTSARQAVEADELEPGIYIVEEELTAEQAVNYKKVASQVVELKDGEPAKVHFENISTKSKIKLSKYNEDKTEYLDNAVFEIYRLAKDDEIGEEITINNIKYNVVSADLTYTIKSGTAVIATVDENGNYTETTQKGIGFSGLLEPGETYFLKEIETPSGWLASNLWTKVGPLVSGELSEVEVTNYKPISPIGTKVDGLNKRVKGATFGLIDSKENAEKLLAMSSSEIESLLQSDVAAQRSAGILQTCVTKSNGEIKFNNLDSTKSYIIIELLAPENYEKDNSIHEVTIKYEGKQYYFMEGNDRFNVVNYEYQKIWIKKQLLFAGEKSNLNGITFDIYKAVESTNIEGAIENNGKYYVRGDKVDSVITGSDTGAGSGGAVSKGLPAGKYIVVENTDNDKLPENMGIVPPASNAYLVELTHVDSNENMYNKVLYDTPIINTTNYGKFFLSKVANDKNKTLLNATFKLQVEKNGSYIDYVDQKVNIITAKKLYELPIFLPEGKYQLIETKIEDGYTLNSNPIQFEIKSGKITGMDENGAFKYYDLESDAKNNPIEVVNNAQGRVELTKLGKQISTNGITLVDNVKLNGAAFDIYKYKLTDGSLVLDEKVGTATSNNQGVLKFKDANGKDVSNKNWLNAGDYVIKETSVGNNTSLGYEAKFTGKFTVVSGAVTTKVTPIDETGKQLGEASSNIINESTYGKFLITKVDKYNDNKKLQDVSFDIYTFDGVNYNKVNNSSMTTNDNGEAVSKLLPEGQYYVKETKTLSGYVLDDKYYGPYEVKALTVNDLSSNVITNAMKQSIEVIKIDSISEENITENAMTGTEFELYESDQTTSVAKAGYSNGKIVFNNLQPDTVYYLKEIQAPQGYELDSTLIEVKTGKTQDDSNNPVVVTKKVENDLLGSLTIEKLAEWNLPSNGGTEKLPLSGAEFTLYQRNADGSNGNEVAKKNTDRNGSITFIGLAQGNYNLVETKVPDGFAENSTVYHVIIVKGKENKVYTGNGAIVNNPNLGKFEFTKTKADGTPLANAKFKLVKITSSNEESVVAAFENFGTDSNGNFSSAMLEPGTYKLYEIETPSGFATIEPIQFNIVAKQITRVSNDTSENIVDDALGSVTIKKYNDISDYTSESNQPLAGVSFGLYKTNDELVTKLVTDSNGKITWDNLNPGEYYVQEIDDQSNPDGYVYSNIKYNVKVETGKSTKVDYTPTNAESGIINKSSKGLIVIEKEDKDTNKALAGAQFTIYSIRDTDLSDPIETITTNNDGRAVSGLLGADANGTSYIVIETKAPDGYILDNNLDDIKKLNDIDEIKNLSNVSIVKVYPVQDATVIIDDKVSNEGNYAKFTNISKNSMLEFTTGIKKGISILMKDSVTAERSLSIDDYSTTFAIRDFAKGENKVKASEIRVSDIETIMQYYDTTQGKYVEDNMYLQDAYPYVVDSVRVYTAYNNIKKSDPINAKIQYQTINNGEWKDVPNGIIENVNLLGNNSQVIDLDNLPNEDKALHVRVVYTGADAGFVSDGFDINITFNQRPSSAQYHEITKITNVAEIEYDFVIKDETGKEVVINENTSNEHLQRYHIKSNEVEILFPTLEQSTPTVNIGVRAIDPNGDNKLAFKPGDIVNFNVTARNISENGADFIDPIISLDLPINVSLNQSYDKVSPDSFHVVVGTLDASGNMSGEKVELDDLIISYTPVEDARVGDNLESSGQPTTKITFKFRDGRILPANQAIQISLAGTISPNMVVSERSSLWMPVYLNSEQKIVKSAENPYGNSFSVNSSTVSSNPLVEDTVLDKVLDSEEIGGNKYAANFADFVVNDNNSLSIFKQVKGEFDSEYLDYNNIAQTSPNGSIDYNIQVRNGEDSDRAVNKIRVVDLLPFYGDSLVSRDNSEGNDTVTPRSTQLERDAILNSVSVLTDLPVGANAKIYYCIDAYNLEEKWSKWTIAEREKLTKEEELPMLYSSMKDSVWDEANKTHNWVLSDNVAASQLQYVSAVAVEISFTDENPFQRGDTLNIHLNMTAPLYGTQEVEAYQDKLLANSAMVAVGRVNSGEDQGILNSDRIENHEVKVKISLPKGTIGDYAFYDINRNGVQDDDDTPVAGLPVKLHQFKTYYNGDRIETSKTVISDDGNGNLVLTDDAGYYEFTNLDCNVPLPGKDSSSIDPNDFAGGAYYEYLVEFSLPDDETSLYKYVPTTRYNANNIEIDSNIGEDEEQDDYLKTERIRLTATKVGNEYFGETNNTLDAGFMALAALGDYVWFDSNRNGIQDEGEVGVNGVTVNLYRVDEANNLTRIGSTVTKNVYGKDGYYLFEELEDDRYVVEFDISAVSPSNLEQFKNNSHSEKFGFTTGYASDNSAIDSNAVNKVDISEYVMRSDVINLGYRDFDMTIDAGLTVHSAITGIAFEDRNYSNIQDIDSNDLDNSTDVYIPGTVVELYEIDETTGLRGENPIAQMTVGEDGKYLFDNLVEGDYQVRFIFPDGYKIVEPNIGDDDTLDNDVEFEISENRKDGYTDIITIPQNSLVEHVDGGAARYSSLGDYVWFDKNSDGLQDDDEKGIAEVPVYLRMKVGEDGIWEQVASQTTDENGYYRFDDLKSSDYDTGIIYQVIFDLPINTKLTITKQGDDHEIDSNALAMYLPGAGFPTDEITLGYNTVDLTWDAGIIESRGAVGDYVWFDENRNGIQDEVNTGIGGISVVLEYNSSEDGTDNSAWSVVDQTTTNDSGYYIFTDLGPGTYRVRFQIDLPYYVTLSNIGNDLAIDSDGVTKFNENWYYSRPFYLEDEGYDMTWDCGVYLPEEIPSLTTNILTGDNTSILGYITLGFVSLGTIGAYYYSNKKRKNKAIKG